MTGLAEVPGVVVCVGATKGQRLYVVYLNGYSDDAFSFTVLAQWVTLQPLGSELLSLAASVSIAPVDVSLEPVSYTHLTLPTICSV